MTVAGRAATGPGAGRDREAVLLPPLRGPAAVLVVLCAGTLVALGLHYRGASRAGRLDTWLSARLREAAPRPGRGLDVVTTIGTPAAVGGLAVALAVVAVALQQRRTALLAIGGPGATGLANAGVKVLVGRTLDGDLALPSGHTAGVTSVAVVVALLVLGRAGPPTVLRAGSALGAVVAVAAAMAFALVDTDSHYPTDTLAGFCAAITVTLGLAFLLDAPGRRRGAGP